MASVKAVAAKSKKTEGLFVKINTAIPLLSLLLFAVAAGKLVTDVSHIRELMEMRARFEDARYSTLESRVAKGEERTQLIESFIGIHQIRPRGDGQPRTDR